MEILNHNAKKAIEGAYDSFPKEVFLERLYDYIRSSIDLARQEEKFERQIMTIGNKVTELTSEILADNRKY